MGATQPLSFKPELMHKVSKAADTWWSADQVHCFPSVDTVPHGASWLARPSWVSCVLTHDDSSIMCKHVLFWALLPDLHRVWQCSVWEQWEDNSTSSLTWGTTSHMSPLFLLQVDACMMLCNSRLCIYLHKISPHKHWGLMGGEKKFKKYCPFMLFQGEWSNRG